MSQDASRLRSRKTPWLRSQALIDNHRLKREGTMDYRTVGVVVARFQTPELHEGHRYLLDIVASLHCDLLVVLGSPDYYCLTERDPLDFVTRRAMVRHAYPKAVVAELRDDRSDAVWSAGLDALVTERFPGREVILYGSRDSFIPHYAGRFRAVELPPLEQAPATALRADAAGKPLKSRDFRAGVIYAAAKRPPLTFPVVDIAILDPAEQRVLLGGRRGGERLGFLGGFVDPKDGTLEEAAKREAMEETSGMEVDNLQYLGSTRISDWRYCGSRDSILSAFFVATRIFGRAEPGDDIARLEWVAYEEFQKRLAEEHAPLGRMLAKHLASGVVA